MALTLEDVKKYREEKNVGTSSGVESVRAARERLSQGLPAFSQPESQTQSRISTKPKDIVSSRARQGKSLKANYLTKKKLLGVEDPEAGPSVRKVGQNPPEKRIDSRNISRDASAAAKQYGVSYTGDAEETLRTAGRAAYGEGKAADAKALFEKADAQKEWKETPSFHSSMLAPASEGQPSGVDNIPVYSGRLHEKYGAGDYLSAAGHAAMGTISGMSNGVVQTAKAFNDLARSGFELASGLKTTDGLQPLWDLYNRLDQNAQDRVAEDIRTGKMSEPTYAIISGLTQQIPTVALAILSGGSSVAAEGASAALGNPSAVEAGIKALPQMFKDPQFLFSFTQTFGPTYQDARENGANPAQAFLAAVVDALPESAIEVGGGLETALAEGPVTGAKDLIGRIGKSALEEAGEEIRQDPFSGLARMTYDPGVNKVSLTDEDAVVNPVRGAKSAFYAFITSALSGGVGTTLRTAQDYHTIGTQVKESGNLNSMLLTAMDSQDETLRDQAADLAYQVKSGKNVSSAAVGKMALQVAEEVNREQTAALQENTRQWVERHQEDIKQIDAAETAWEEAWKDPEKRKASLADAEESAQKEQKRSAAAEAARRAAEARQENATQRRKAAAESQQGGKTPVSVSMAEQLGENGRKAYEYTLEKSGVEEEGIRPAFLAYYTYGLAGSAMENVPEEFKSALSGDAAYRAWASGQNDAAVSLRNDQEKVKFASLAGEDSGLVYDDFVNEAVKSGRSRVDINEENRTYLSAETAEQINETAKALGLRVQFADSVRGGTANAQISGDTILIEKDNPNPVLAIAGHEFGHRLQELAPEEYRRFRESILEGREQEVRDKAAQYAKLGVNVTYEEAMNEVANDQAGLLMDGGEVLDRFIEQHRSDRTLLQKMRDAIRSFIDKVTGKERKRLETAEGKLEAALNAAAKEAKALQKKSAGDMMGKGKYSLKEDENYGTVRRNQTESEGVGASGAASARAGQASDTGRSGQNRQGVGGEVRSEVGSTVRREDFLREHRERGDRSVSLKSGAIYAYHEATETELNDNARKAVSILKELGIPCFTTTDGIHIYANGKTRTSSQAVTIRDGSDVKVSISAKMGTEGVSTAYHEAFHFLGDIAPAIRNKLQGIIRESIVKNRSYETFANRIAEGYQIPLDPSQRTKAQEAKFQEELNAYICGEIMARNPGSEAWQLIRNFIPDTDAVYSAVVDMYTDFKAQQKGDAKFSLKTDSQGRELSEEQQKFFKDSKVRDEDGRLLTMYHGTRAENGDFTVFDYSKAVKKGGLGLKALGKGNYFTSKQLNGSERFGSRVIEAYLNVTNPFIYDGANGDTVSLAEQVQKKTGISTQGMNTDALQDAMRKLGYDGIVEYRRDGSLGIAVTFDSEQIKYTTNQKPTSDPDIRYSLKNVDGYEQFRRDLQEWVKDGRPSGERFILGSTGSVLQGLGAIESDIYMNGDKISTILKEHPEMSLREIQRIPEMLEDPVLVLKSKGTGKGGNNSRMVLYSSIKAQNGQPVLAVLDLRPQENGFLLDDMQKVNSSYTKDNPARFVTGSDVLYADKKRTIPLLRQFGLTITSRQLLRSGSIGSISYNGNLVNMEGMPFSSVVDFAEEEAEFSLKTGTITKSYEAVLEENRLLREQMKDYRSLKKQNRNLQESRDYWKGQTKPTKEVSTDRKAVGKAASELLKSYSSEADVSDIQDRLQNLYDSIARGDEGVSYEEAWKRAEAIAKAVIDKAVAKESLGESYQELLSYLKDTKIRVEEGTKSDIPDYSAFQRQQKGRLSLNSQDGAGIDQVYQELAERWPEFFDETEYTNPSDQLLQIADVADQLRQVEEYNPFEGEMDQVVAGAANEILERFFDLPQTKKTFADRQEAKLNAAKAQGKQQVQKVREEYKERLDKLRQANRQRVADAIDRERAKRDRKLQELKDRYAARDAAGRESRNARELRAKIIRHTSELSKKLLHPSDKHHIPEKLRTAVSVMLESINLESPYRVDENGKRQKGGSGSPTRRTAAFLALKEQYAHIAAEGGDIVIDPALFGDAALDIQGGFDTVISMKNIRLADMSTEQLQTVWQVVKAVEHSVSTAGKLLSKTKYDGTTAWASAISADTAGRRTKESLTKGHASMDLENPYTFFSHYGEAGQVIFRTLRNAQDQQQMMKSHVAEEAGKIADPATVERLEKSAHTFSTERGDTLTLSTDQVMELYELAKRGQARDHLLMGGIIQPEVKSARVRRGTDSIRLSEADLAAITETLTQEQKQIADRLQGMTTGILADYGNEASMAAYGYKKFTGKDYWPINSAGEGLHSSVEKNQDRTRSIRNIGMAQATTPHANNPLELPGIFNTFADHVSDMTKYAAWLCTMEDMDRLFNYKFRDEEGNLTGKTMKGMLDRVGGPGSQKYWRNLMEDIQNGIGGSNDSAMWSMAGKAIGTFKAASVSGNIRVVIQQPTAFFRAADVLEAKDMTRGLVRGVTKGNGWEKALRYAPIAVIKDDGSFDISNPRQMKEVLFDGRSLVQKVNDTLSSPAGKADAITWGKLWNASEWAVAREHPDLVKGSEEFYRETARQFTEVIDQTQVVDGVLQRSNIMRSSNEVVKQATSFMGEPIMSLNMMMRAYDRARYETTPVKRKKAVKRMVRTASALVVTNVVNALVVSLVDAARDDDPDKDLAEKYRIALLGDYDPEGTIWDNIRAGLSANLIEALNPLALIPFVKDALSMVEGYEVKRMDAQGLAELIDAAKKWEKLGSGRYTVAYLLKDTAGSVSKLTGIPIGNVLRDLSALTNTGISAADSFGADTVELRYRLSRTMYDVKNSQNLGLFTGLIWEARQKGNEELARTIYNDLIRSGWSNEKLDQRLNTLAKKALDGSDLVSQYLDAEEKGNASGMEKAAAAAGDRGFSGQEFQAAVNQERNRRKKGSEEAAAGQEIQDGYWAGGETEYSYGNLYQAVRNGDSASVSSIRKALEASGKSEKDIDSAVKSRIRADLKDSFWESGSLGDPDVRKFLQLLSEWDSGTDGKDYLEKATWKKWKETYQGGKGEYPEYRKYYDILKKVFEYENAEIIRKGKGEK